MTAEIGGLEAALRRELDKVVVGAETTIRALTIALVARGHVLLQGAPGLGKTLLAKTFAAATSSLPLRIKQASGYAGSSGKNGFTAAPYRFHRASRLH